MNPRPRRARPCAVCQTVRVIETKVCSKCQIDFKGQEQEPWYQFAIQSSDDTARLIRRKQQHEVPILYENMH